MTEDAKLCYCALRMDVPLATLHIPNAVNFYMVKLLTLKLTSEELSDQNNFCLYSVR